MDEKHDYEPSDDKPGPMHSDPPCEVCGQPKNSPAHT